jgi:hypothetical protein
MGIKGYLGNRPSRPDTIFTLIPGRKGTELGFKNRAQGLPWVL